MSRARLRLRSTAVLDNEALQALADVTHPKHRKMLSVIDGGTRRPPGSIVMVTPAAVRVEAEVARSGAGVRWPGISGVLDVELTGAAADRAIDLRRRAGAGSVVDATVVEAADRHAETGWVTTIYTSDVTDLTALAAAAPKASQIGIRRI